MVSNDFLNNNLQNLNLGIIGLHAATSKSPQISTSSFILPSQLPDTLLSKPLSDNDLEWEYIVGKVF
jgi:hypothetical protein